MAAALPPAPTPLSPRPRRNRISAAPTAAAAAKLGLGAVLLLRGHDGLPVTGNLLLDRLLGAEIEFIETADPYDPGGADPPRRDRGSGCASAAGGRICSTSSAAPVHSAPPPTLRRGRT